MAVEDYTDDMNNICLHKEESVVVLDKVSLPGMYKVVKLRSDGSRGDDIWVPESILQRKKSTAEIILSSGELYFIAHIRIHLHHICRFTYFQLFRKRLKFAVVNTVTKRNYGSSKIVLSSADTQ